MGGLYPTRWETADGYEATLAMSFVGPYVLTAELVPLLRAGAPSRCISVVSAGFKLWKTDPFTDVQSAEHFISGDVYAHTKLLNVLASLALARRLDADRVTMNLVLPGMLWTQMTQSMTAQSMPSWRLVWPLIRLLQRRGSPAKAAGGSPSSPPPLGPRATRANTSRANTHPARSPPVSSTPRTRIEPGNSGPNSELPPRPAVIIPMHRQNWPDNAGQ